MQLQCRFTAKVQQFESCFGWGRYWVQAMPDMSCHRLENLELRSFVSAVLCCVLCSLAESLIQFNDQEAWSCHVGIIWIIAKYSCEFCLVPFTISPRHLHAYNMKKIQDKWDLVDTLAIYDIYIYIFYIIHIWHKFSKLNLCWPWSVLRSPSRTWTSRILNTFGGLNTLVLLFLWKPQGPGRKETRKLLSLANCLGVCPCFWSIFRVFLMADNYGNYVW